MKDTEELCGKNTKDAPKKGRRRKKRDLRKTRK
jgi:hypothetical protein